MKLILKLIYKPFGIVFGLLTGLVARQAFEALWSQVDEHEAPTPTTREATWPKVLGAASLKALTFALTKAVTDRLSAQTFRYLFGIWPGEQRVKAKGE